MRDNEARNQIYISTSVANPGHLDHPRNGSATAIGPGWSGQLTRRTFVWFELAWRIL